MPLRQTIWIGFDPREAAAYAVARGSILNRSFAPWVIHGLNKRELEKSGLYTRATEKRDGILWDSISEAPMATEFAISRFLTPALAGTGWALFMDCDMLVRTNIARLFELTRQDYAVMCVKHDFAPSQTVKMDGQTQTIYPRKNWSSVMLFNCDHPANKRLTVEMVNTLPGRDLHRFCWLRDEEIGSLPVEWNWLAGHSDNSIDPKIVHFTDGVPSMPGYENAPYADEWRNELARWVA